MSALCLQQALGGFGCVQAAVSRILSVPKCFGVSFHGDFPLELRCLAQRLISGAGLASFQWMVHAACWPLLSHLFECISVNLVIDSRSFVSHCITHQCYYCDTLRFYFNIQTCS